jgi:hypothetical protein
MNFEELLEGIEHAQQHVEMESGLSFEEILDQSYESLEFAAGHILGMRDCLIAVQNILIRGLIPEVQTGEEE